jgi:hypothetical protein
MLIQLVSLRLRRQALLCTLILVGGVGNSGSFPGRSIAHASQYPVPARTAGIFRGLLPALHRTGVPAFLPRASTVKHKYAAMETSTHGSYSIEIGYVPNCLGHACEYGTLQGWKRGSAAHVPPGKLINLAGGFAGHWQNFTCGANCGDSTITVDVGAYRYSFGLKAGSLSGVRQLTNSALRAGSV